MNKRYYGHKDFKGLDVKSLGNIADMYVDAAGDDQRGQIEKLEAQIGTLTRILHTVICAIPDDSQDAIAEIWGYEFVSEEPAAQDGDIKLITGENITE